jgi:hypothetical protein
MVISFRHDAAWKQLLAEFEVVTFRTDRRADPDGTTWCNRGDGEPKEFEVEVEEIGAVDPSVEALDEFVPQSGFESADAWLRAIEELNGDRPEEGWLYRVVPVEIPATKIKEYLEEMEPSEHV